MSIGPDADARTAMGPNSLDRSRLRPSAEAGLRQAAGTTPDLAGVWNAAQPGR